MKKRVVKIKMQCNRAEEKKRNCLALMERSCSTGYPLHKGCSIISWNSRIG